VTAALGPSTLCHFAAVPGSTSRRDERHPTELRELLISDPEDMENLGAIIQRWRSAMAYWKHAIAKSDSSDGPTYRISA
jgi:hypothetical protein